MMSHLTSGQKGHLAVGEKGKQLPELAPCTFEACDRSQVAATSCREHVPKVAELPSYPPPTPPHQTPPLPYPTQPNPNLPLPLPYPLRIQTHAHNQASRSRATLSCDSSYYPPSHWYVLIASILPAWHSPTCIVLHCHSLNHATAGWYPAFHRRVVLCMPPSAALSHDTAYAAVLRLSKYLLMQEK